MKRFLAATAMLALTACATEVEPGDRPHFWNGSNNLTIFIFDGLTGAGVTGATVRIQVGPTSLTGDHSDNAYSLSQIPGGTFPIFIEAAGYLDFVATKAFTGNNVVGITNPTITYEAVTVVLFPVRSVDQDITIRAYEQEDATPVASGTVVATINTASGVGVPVPSLGTTQLTGSLGYLPRTIIASIANGVAVLPKDQLVFGATYVINVVAARNLSGEYLQALLDLERVTAGDDFHEVIIFMGPPAETPMALTANNEDGGIQPTLIVTFPYPMEICSKPEDHDWTNMAGNTDADSVVATPDDTAPVTTTLTDSNRTLTLSFNTEAGANTSVDPQDDLRVRFDGIEVRIVGSSTCVDLFNVDLRDTGNTVDPDIEVQDVP